MSSQAFLVMKDSAAIAPPCAAKPAIANPTVKSRVEWVDASRALAMFFIMWQHTRNSPEWIGSLLGGALCLFFVLAGYFLPRSPEKCLRRTKELFIAWCLWSLISYIYCMDPVNPFAQSWQRAIGWGVSAINTPLWFLKNLIIYQFIMCALMYLRVLPRYALALLVLLASFSYTNEYGQHESLRFSWMMALVFGYAMAHFPLARITQYMRDHALMLNITVLLILVQPPVLGLLALYFDMSAYSPKIPISSFAYALIFMMLALSLEDLWPRIVAPLALVGRCMMFVYAAHVLLHAAIISFEIQVLGGINLDGPWTPLVDMLILTPLCLFLQRRFPRVMSLLGSRPSRATT